MKPYLLATVMLVAASAAHAQTSHDGHDMSHMIAAAPTGFAVSSSTAEFKAADAKMHKAMAAVAYTGDVDVDFLRGMIPHHEGAVDMAKIVLKYSIDPDVRMLAGDILKAQDKEIRQMKDWLAKHGPADAAPAVAEPLIKAEPKADAKTEETTEPKIEKVEPKAVVPTSQTVPTKPVAPDVVPDAKASDTRVEAPVKTEAKVAALVVSGTAVSKTNGVLPVSSTVPVSGTIAPTPGVPVDVVTPTTVGIKAPIVIMSTSATAMILPDGLPQSLTPDMPMPDMAIVNEAPEMDLLDAGKGQ